MMRYRVFVEELGVEVRRTRHVYEDLEKARRKAHQLQCWIEKVEHRGDQIRFFVREDGFLPSSSGPSAPPVARPSGGDFPPVQTTTGGRLTPPPAEPGSRLTPAPAGTGGLAPAKPATEAGSWDDECQDVPGTCPHCGSWSTDCCL